MRPMIQFLIAIVAHAISERIARRVDYLPYPDSGTKAPTATPTRSGSSERFGRVLGPFLRGPPPETPAPRIHRALSHRALPPSDLVAGSSSRRLGRAKITPRSVTSNAGHASEASSTPIAGLGEAWRRVSKQYECDYDAGERRSPRTSCVARDIHAPDERSRDAPRFLRVAARGGAASDDAPSTETRTRATSARASPDEITDGISYSNPPAFVVTNVLPWNTTTHGTSMNRRRTAAPHSMRLPGATAPSANWIWGATFFGFDVVDERANSRASSDGTEVAIRPARRAQ
jgi:hypothetical protein